jgi:acyl-coenzyme A synthetase/AMP-(fatty) acid ligase
MNMSRSSLATLSNAIVAAGALSSRLDAGVEGSASWGELAAGSALDLRAGELRESCVLLAVTDQFAAAAALIQIDGVASRMVLYPPDLSREHLAYVAETAGARVIVTDRPLSEPIDAREVLVMPSRSEFNAVQAAETSPVETEWILLTSGTTGRPKLVQHTLASLTGAIDPGYQPGRTWSTFYDIRRYGGLQIFLRAILTGTPLVLKSAQQSVAEFLTRAGELGVTHILGTPSHWRRALMSPAASFIAPQYVRLSGEIADQAILNNLHQQYPQATIAHAFASTEAGVAFVVEDGLMGLPVESLRHAPGVKMKVENGTLRVRSDRMANCYLGDDTRPLKDAEGFVDTGDAMELHDGRYYFAGRRDGIINVGGLKVHPEEVEAVINRHPQVSMSLVRGRKSPITGSIVVADVVLRANAPNDSRAPVLQSDILQFCRAELAHHKVPAAINFVPSLAVSDSGKMVRSHA